MVKTIIHPTADYVLVRAAIFHIRNVSIRRAVAPAKIQVCGVVNLEVPDSILAYRIDMCPSSAGEQPLIRPLGD